MPTNSTINPVSFLAFAKNQVSKSLYKALTVILKPCCDISITNVGFTCTSTNVATVAVTVSGTTTFPVDGTAIVAVTQTHPGLGVKTIQYSTTYTAGTNPSTITVTGVAISGATATYVVTLVLPTDFSVNTGVFQKSNSFVATNPSCT